MGNRSINENKEIRKNLFLSSTDDMDSLNSFFEENELEISDAEPVETNVIKAWKIENEKDEIVAGICLAFRENEYIIDGIAVDGSLRGLGIGQEILDIAKDEVRKRGGDKIFLVAKAPGFFKTQGYVTIEQEEAPLFYECAECPQYKVDCFPERMKWEDEK